MRKKIISVLMTMVLTVGALTGCAEEKKADNTFIMCDVQEGEHPTALASDYFAKIVGERTEGRVNIKVYHGSTLGTEAEQVEQIMCGGIDFARVSTSPISSLAYDELKAFQALYLYENQDQMWKVLKSKLGDSFLNSSQLTDNGIVGLSWFSGGSRNFYNNDHEVKTPADLKGLTLRVNTDPMMALMEKEGAVGKNIAYADILASIKSGDIQGAENNWPSYISTEHYTVAKYITIDEHTSIPEMLVASTKAFKRISESDQEIIRQCALEATEFQIKAMKDYDNEAIKQAKEAGCVITKLDDAAIAQFQKVGKEINSEVSADYMDIINKIQSIK